MKTFRIEKAGKLCRECDIWVINMNAELPRKMTGDEGE